MSLLTKKMIYILGLSFGLLLSACADDITVKPEAEESELVNEADLLDEDSELDMADAASPLDDSHEKNKSLAMKGDAQAQLELGYDYLYGFNVSRDLEQAARWLEAAAENGNAEAQHSLAMMYDSGEGVDKDTDKAMELYLKSANQGYDLAQLSLAQAYSLGYNDEYDTDYVKAAEWATRAAFQENESAQRLLASFYLHGFGVRRNKTIAKEWYNRSCSNGSEYSCTESNKLSAEGY